MPSGELSSEFLYSRIPSLIFKVPSNPLLFPDKITVPDSNLLTVPSPEISFTLFEIPSLIVKFNFAFSLIFVAPEK